MADDIEELRMEQIRADVRNKDADSNYKLTLARWEPWKAMATAFGAGAAFTLAMIGLISFVLLHK